MNEKGVSHHTGVGKHEDHLKAELEGKNGVYNKANSSGRPSSDRWHNLIVSNIAIGIGSRLHGHKSEIYISNMQVKLRNNYICFPDVAIVSGEPSFGDQISSVLLNPTLVIDVFSSRTDTSDKTKKLESLLATDSIKECVLVKQDEMRIEHYARQNQKQWIYRIYNERDDVVSLDSINCKISLQEVYAQIKFNHAEFSSKAVN